MGLHSAWRGVKCHSSFIPPMKTKSKFELCSAFLRSSSFWHDEITPDSVEGPVITISQAAGARGNPIAEVLAGELQGNRNIPRFREWTIFNQSLVERVIEENNLPKSTVNFLAEDKRGRIADYIGEALGLHKGAYTGVVKTAETILRIAQSGNAVIVGRGGNFITRKIEMAVHVRLVGSLDTRIKSFARIYGVTPAEAEKEVARRDRARRDYIQENFVEDINDPCHYDMVINTDNFSDTAAARLIIAALEEKASLVRASAEGISMRV